MQQEKILSKLSDLSNEQSMILVLKIFILQEADIFYLTVEPLKEYQATYR
jgi:hypothetical protein